MTQSAVLMTSRLCSMTTHRVALVDEAVQHFHQLGDVVEMQARRRLVEDVERLAGGAPRQFLGELDALRLAARQRRRLLADLDIAEADLVQRHHLVADAGHGLEEVLRLLDRHVEHVGDRLALELHVERLAAVALALADLAGDVDIRQEVHLDLDDAVALAGLAAAALDVEREAAGAVAARLRLRQAREPLADRRERAGIGGRVGARCAPDRRLVDIDDLVDELEPLDPVVLCRMEMGAVQVSGDGGIEGIDQEGRLAAAGDAGDAGECAERDVGGDVLQVVAARADDADAPSPPRSAAAWRASRPRARRSDSGR